MTNPRQGSQPPGRDCNMGPPEYEWVLSHYTATFNPSLLLLQGFRMMKCLRRFIQVCPLAPYVRAHECDPSPRTSSHTVDVYTAHSLSLSFRNAVMARRRHAYL
jgi:hypothetical protein